MLSFHLITVSTHPTGPWEELVEKYTKLVSGLAKFSVTVVKSEKMVSSRTREQVMQAEGERIMAAWPKQGVVIACDEFGKLFTSEQFVSQLNTWSAHHTQTITFIIGGPFGLSSSVKQKAAAALGLAKWTLPHDLAAVTLLEQLYRALTIMQGKPYHHS